MDRRELLKGIAALSSAGLSADVLTWRPDEEAIILVRLGDREAKMRRPRMSSEQQKQLMSAIRDRIKNAGCNFPLVFLDEGLEFRKV